MICEMSNCFDLATYGVDFWQYSESFQICEGCALYWEQQPNDTPKPKKYNEGK